jgi:hypothetical protein
VQETNKKLKNRFEFEPYKHQGREDFLTESGTPGKSIRLSIRTKKPYLRQQILQII